MWTTDLATRSYFVDLPPGKYQVRAGFRSAVAGFDGVHDLGDIVIDGDRRWDIRLTDASAVEEIADNVPERFRLEQNYPNPFNPATVIRYEIPEAGAVSLAIYNLIGQRVATLAEGTRETGAYSVHWDGRDDRGQVLASGVYLYRLQAGTRAETRKMLLIQ